MRNRLVPLPAISHCYTEGRLWFIRNDTPVQPNKICRTCWLVICAFSTASADLSLRMLSYCTTRSSMLQRLAATASRRGAVSARVASSRSSALRFSATRSVVATCGASSSSGVALFSTMSERFASSYSRQKRGKQGNDEPKEQLNIGRIAVVGGGNMAEAIITGVLSEELIPREKIVVSDPNPDIRKKYQSKDIMTSDRNVTAVRGADVIVMAVKPQVLKEVHS
ncbi:Pyrroline-5-carboxylate reductase, partial [Globisporangium splendens]